MLNGLLALGGGLGELAGTAAGEIFGQDDRRRAEAEFAKTLRELEALGIPSVEAQKIALEQMGDSSLAGVKVDPRLKDAQSDALGAVQRVGREGGLTAEDRAKMLAAQNMVAQQERSQRGAIVQNMQARGMGGSGAELAAQLANQQGSANRLNQAGTDMAAEAQKRALQAMVQGGQMAGQMRAQDYGEQSDLARARDEIARFNTQNRNQSQIYNSQLQQQQFQNQMAKQGALADARSKMAARYDDKAKRRSQMGAGAGGALGVAGGVLGGLLGGR
jgi:hypothetical protein